jgi:hypothetical protein
VLVVPTRENLVEKLPASLPPAIANSETSSSVAIGVPYLPPATGSSTCGLKTRRGRSPRIRVRMEATVPAEGRGIDSTLEPSMWGVAKTLGQSSDGLERGRGSR